MFAILSHTPVWVWAILAALVFAGRAMTRDRAVPLPLLFLVPTILLGLAIQGIVQHFGTVPALLIWAVALVAGVVAGQATMSPAHVARGARGPVLKGSYVPMMLMVSVFLVKYAVGVLFAMNPVLMSGAAAAALVPVIYGLLNGIFLGRSLRVVRLYYRLSPGGAALAA